jgi:hypothetical protein
MEVIVTVMHRFDVVVICRELQLGPNTRGNLPAFFAGTLIGNFELTRSRMREFALVGFPRLFSAPIFCLTVFVKFLEIVGEHLVNSG